MRKIRESRFSKIVAYYLLVNLIVELVAPTAAYALTSGPTQPEFNSFTPIATSDMVDLASGDFNYNIPIMDVGGYPINLAYNSGVTMDQEASWVGLGWNLNVGEISRQVRGLPDDFRGDPMIYENYMRENITIGSNLNLSPAIFGTNFPFSLGLGVQYNNYEGVSWTPSIGISYSLAGCANVGFNLTGNVTEGATLSPSLSISGKVNERGKFSGSLGGSIGASINSRQGLQNISVSAVSKTSETVCRTIADGGNFQKSGNNNSVGGSISLNNTHNYTPTKRVAYINNNKTFGATLGGEVFGVEGEVRISGSGSYQSIHPAFYNRTIGGYGYENTHYKNGLEGVLDFNREKEQPTINKNTTSLPVTNYTYDTYNIEGQGVSGMFRPYRSQVGYVYNDEINDFSDSGSFGVEIGMGNLVHGGVDFKVSPTQSRTGRWIDGNFAIPFYSESNNDKNDPLFEQVAFKHVGELNVDRESALFTGAFRDRYPLCHNIGGSKHGRYLAPSVKLKQDINKYSIISDNPTVKRQSRYIRNQSIQKVTALEAAADNFFVRNKLAKDHHTAGMRILKTDGSTYVFGDANYNSKKVEATFDVSGEAGNNVEGLVNYRIPSIYGHHNSFSDMYVNKITTPSYAHSFSLTTILSPDYQDIDNNGPNDSDLGTYTKFDYLKINDFKWRVPYLENHASYNEGLRTSNKDQKGNYIYGVKQLSYLRKIETKTHVAFIDFGNRKDAMSVKDEHGGRGDIPMKYIESIRLYSKAELKKDIYGSVIDPKGNYSVSPIKIAHFEYDYSLCKNIPSNNGEKENDENGVNINQNKGKLTLKKVYFTYKDSNMGKFTPYVFTYSDNNPEYHIKANDIWGNYAELKTNGPTNAEFPFVEQDASRAATNTGAWTLKTIKLPSGGQMTIHTESDDYKYVQNKKAMQMYKVAGAGNSANPSSFGNSLYGLWGNHSKYLYVKIKDSQTPEIELDKATSQFNSDYLSEQLGKPIYFKFLLNMTTQFDYVSGYFEIDGRSNVFNKDGKTYAAIPLRLLDTEGGSSGNSNPISKAGWGFGRTFLNRAVYSLGGDEVNNDFESIVSDLLGSIGAMAEIFTGPNGKLESKGCASIFDPNRSWIRLENPDGHKLGGGLRVKKIELSDQWAVMNSIAPNSVYENDIYDESYGQEYSYTLDDTKKTSSGVATFEPNASPENPFVEPFYSNEGNYADKIASPKELNYVEKPFGESFFPSPRITYSRVTVKNLNKLNESNKNLIIKKHATGKVVTEHYTSYDFPTIVDYTNLNLIPDLSDNPVFVFLDIYSQNHLTASQGFSIETNDMNGKVRSQSVFPEGNDNPISKVEYKYNVGKNGRLDNTNFKTVNSKGEITTQMMGVDYDMVHDFNESSSTTESFGVNTNLATFLVAIFPMFVPVPLPTYARHENMMHTATSTKVVHKTGVLIETIATDLGSKVSTKNLAWDAKTGQVLATETINEFDDKYYTFNYPAYWYYENMGMACENLDIQGELSGTSIFNIVGVQNNQSNPISNYFKIADELLLGDGTKLWVFGYDGLTGVKLMDRLGNEVSQTPINTKFKVIRSGNKNLQNASMASVTSMVNPVPNGATKLTSFEYVTGSTTIANKKVINASAIEYNDNWPSQCENSLPNALGLINGIPGQKVNPYLYNLRGNWRPVKSYAYLSARNNYVTPNRRNSGYFTNYKPFYNQDAQGRWTINYDKWTYASEITKFSPYGVELENKDALSRFSSAQFGYEYKLPVAVSSNAQYSEMGFDGFEDYLDPLNPSTKKPHFGFSQAIDANGAIVTKQKSHTGNNSLLVKPGKKATFVRKMGGCKE